MRGNKGYQMMKSGGAVKKIDRETRFDRMGGMSENYDTPGQFELGRRSTESPEKKAERSIGSTARSSRHESDIKDIRGAGDLLTRKDDEDEE